jgi:hypothetical protein
LIEINLDITTIYISILAGGWYQWEVGDIRKGCRRANMGEILGTHV